MKTFSLLLVGGALFCSGAVHLPAQSSTEKSLKTSQADLERQRLDLEKKSLELQRKELELEKMRQELQARESGQSLSMNLSGDVLFDYEKATLKPAAEEALKKVAVVLSQFPDSKVAIEGYTDAKGGAAVNLPLSRERANAVRDWLVKNGGMNMVNITANGRGEENPIAPNTNPDGSDNPAGRALNRRVTIVVARPPAPAP